MSIADKVAEIKKLISLICDVVPQLVAIVRETISIFREV